jgi:hypothetical protein
MTHSPAIRQSSRRSLTWKLVRRRSTPFSSILVGKSQDCEADMPWVREMMVSSTGQSKETGP